MDGGVALVADAQTAKVVQVRNAALDGPALATQPGAVPGAASGDDGCDATGSQQAAIRVVVIAAICEEAVGFLAGSPALAGHGPGMQVIEQRDQLGDVVAVAGGERNGKRDAGRIHQQVVFGAAAGQVDRGGPGQEPPRSARGWEPSTLARDQSITPAAPVLTSTRWCRASHTPAAGQSRRRRQQVTPDP